MTVQAATPPDLTEDISQQECDLGCGRNAVFLAKGCMDKEAVQLCQQCLTRGLEVVRNFVRMHQRTHHRIIICGDCYRPILQLDTHLEIKPL
jgi:superfamily II helicase